MEDIGLNTTMGAVRSLKKLPAWCKEIYFLFGVFFSYMKRLRLIHSSPWAIVVISTVLLNPVRREKPTYLLRFCPAHNVSRGSVRLV